MLISNPEKYIELAIKYKTHVMILLAFLLVIAVFFVGRATIDIPPKEVVCKSEIATIESLFTKIEECQNECTKKLRAQSDKDEVECKKRIKQGIEDNRGTVEILSCSEAKAIMPQCKRRGQW